MAMAAILDLEVKMVTNTKNIPFSEFVMPKYKIWDIIYLYSLFTYGVIVFFRFFKMVMAAILDLEVKMVPNTKKKNSIEFVMPK